MSQIRILPVILCGGDGTRLWPMSRPDAPKQFTRLFDDKSLLELTFERLSAFGDLVAVTGEQHRFLVQETAEQAGVSVNQILEPCRRDTAAAMALAAYHAPDTADLLLFCPSDHHIPDTAPFIKMVNDASALAMQGNIVVFGVEPTVPSTAYGYIEIGDVIDGAARRCVQFHEKPSREIACEYVASCRYLWNAGIFLVRPDMLRDALACHVPAIASICQKAVQDGKQDGVFFRPGQVYAEVEGKSIDYAVMEHETRIAVFPFAGRWRDIGSWNAMAAIATHHDNGNATIGPVENIKFVETENTLVGSSQDRVVVTVGVSDLVVVDTADAVLVAAKDRAEMVKQMVGELTAEGRPQAQGHLRVARPWGSYECITRREGYQVKRIMVKPGGRLSLQRHRFRAEHWVVVSGVANVQCDGKAFELGPNQSTYIPVGAMHRIENAGDQVLVLIEVQTGSYLGEDDIERFDDVYGRGE